MEKPDFSGWATKNDIQCSDGAIIRHGAFSHQDKKKVPLVWGHQHTSASTVLGHAILEDRAFGTYAHAYLNDTPMALDTKELIRHGDVESLSIYARNLTRRGNEVLKGDIREVSVVLAGANPGALIDNVYIEHSDGHTDTLDGEAIIYTGLTIEHGEGSGGDDMAGEKKTAEEVYASMNEDQKLLLHAMVGKVADKDKIAHEESDSSDDDSDDDNDDNDDKSDDKKDSDDSDDKKDSDKDDDDDKSDDKDSKEVKHSDNSDDFLRHIENRNQEGSHEMTRNVFANAEAAQAAKGADILAHMDIPSIVEKAVKTKGSLKEQFLAHAEDAIQHAEGDYGINNVNMLFPEAKTLFNTPEFYKRRTEWVQDVLSSVRKSPFARIKTVFADITADEARAKGYITGELKKEEVFELLQRVTLPTTIYKKQKMDRDDVIDITGFDVVIWIKQEMRLMLDEEIARAILIGDGRSNGDPDKVKDPQSAADGAGIRSIANDVDFYAHKVQLPSGISAEGQIDALIRARSKYKGSGSPVYYTTADNVADLLLIRDKIGRRVYETMDALATAIRVSRVVEVEVMETVQDLHGIMVNLQDYNVGADKGGEVNFFDDFDIDYNQLKWLIETRISGTLVRPKAAVVVRRTLGTVADVVPPSFDGPTNTITIPTSAGVEYLIDDEVVTGEVEIDELTTVEARATNGYHIPSGTNTSWTFNYTP